MIVFVTTGVSSAEPSSRQIVANWLCPQSKKLQVSGALCIPPKTPWLLSNTVDCFSAAFRIILGNTNARGPRKLAATQEAGPTKLLFTTNLPRNNVIIKPCNAAKMIGGCRNVHDARRRVAAANQCTAPQQIGPPCLLTGALTKLWKSEEFKQPLNLSYLAVDTVHYTIGKLPAWTHKAKSYDPGAVHFSSSSKARYHQRFRTV